MNDSPPVKVSPSTHRQTSDEFNAQQGKRKFSLSQYKERKRLKSDELQSTHADTDMRLHTAEPLKVRSRLDLSGIEDRCHPLQPTSPIDDSADPPHPAAISPKSEEICKGTHGRARRLRSRLHRLFSLDTVMKSNLSEPGVKKVLKKKVIWADDKNHALVQTSFFEVDDSELSDMHIFARTCATNISIAQLEKVMERDFRKRRGAQHDVNASDTDDKQHATAQPLPPLLRILFPEAIQFPPVVSQERAVQEEREKTVLQALFIRSFLPDSPGEPDGGDLAGGGTASQTEPKLIPLEDVRITSGRDNGRVPTKEQHLTLMLVCLCLEQFIGRAEQSAIRDQQRRANGQRTFNPNDFSVCSTDDRASSRAQSLVVRLR